MFLFVTVETAMDVSQLPDRKKEMLEEFEKRKQVWMNGLWRNR